MAYVSNQSDIVFDHNGTNVTCSLYSISEGQLEYDTDYGTFNCSLDSFPLYFITNCSQASIHYYLGSESPQGPGRYLLPEGAGFILKNEGDSFVSLLFTISGTCIACWMLSFLLIFSPKHKRKPIMTHVATLFNAIVMTILMAKVTEAARSDYYTDHVDSFKIHDVFFSNLTYRISNIFSETLISISFFQIVSRIASKRYQDYIVVSYIVLLIGYLVTDIICESQYKFSLPDVLFRPNGSEGYTRWNRARTSLQAAVVCIFGGLLAYYTLFIKNPRKYSYSKKLIPLALVVWFLFLTHLTVCIVIMAIFRSDWETRSWLSILPNLIEVGILSVVWEWIYNIKALERRTELMGVLGRRISFDDDRIFHTKSNTDYKSRKNRTKVLTWFKEKARFYPAVDVVDGDFSKMNSNSSSKGNTASDTLTQGNTESSTQQNRPQLEDPDDDLYETPRQQEEEEEEEEAVYETGYAEQESDDVQIVMDYEFYEEPGESSNNPLPPFEPHPGFSQNDYWPEKGT